jgi:hypothetical protein
VLAQQLGHLDSPIPNFILLDPCPEGNEFREFKAGNWAGWLGAQYAPVRVGGEFKIENVARQADISSDDHEARNALRKFLTKKYENERRSAAAASQNAVFERVKGLMSCAHLVRHGQAARERPRALRTGGVRTAHASGAASHRERRAVRDGRERNAVGQPRLPQRDLSRCSCRRWTA